ncbi:hypothetical protein F4801DRAFT_574506 [Xylaria longipes]|nr:hypothetical protein F4801DRAFT_574506 [Xylaria longipes]RYC60183.1 hypothetical protein CHU98_g6035 [Xylaria longipes]
MALGPPTPDHTPLLSVPLEIRDAIYELVLEAEWGHSSQDFFVLDRPLPALFRISKQIRSEALDVFLLKNHFHVYTSSIGLKWLDILGRDVNRFRFLILFIDLNLDAWHKYLKALLPVVSEYLELRIRKAAVSLPNARLDSFLKTAGLYDGNRWTSEGKGTNEIIFKQIH